MKRKRKGVSSRLPAWLSRAGKKAAAFENASICFYTSIPSPADVRPPTVQCLTYGLSYAHFIMLLLA